jgi:hypothetical protein
MKIRTVRAELFQADGHDEIVTFGSSAKAPKSNGSPTRGGNRSPGQAEI